METSKMDDAHELKRVLIFDDDADLRSLLMAYLGKLLPDVELEEYDPLSAGPPGDDFKWSRYDVLILDYFLCIHGVTGLDILHTNRNNRDFPATIMLTGAGNEEVAVRALKAGVYDYLRKQSLDKQELKEAILKAFSKHKEQNKRRQEVTQQGQAFNKSLFYQQLEFQKDLPGYRDRVLLLIELDRDDEIAAKAGVILRDNLVRHVARLSFEIFKLGECNPSITRLGDAVIALLIDMPDSLKTLEYNMEGLLKQFDKKPYRFDDKKLTFSVSVGVVKLRGDGVAREIILARARDACKLASRVSGNAYHIDGSKPAVMPEKIDAEKRPVDTPQAPAPVAEEPKVQADAPHPSGETKPATSPAETPDKQPQEPSTAPVSRPGETVPAAISKTVSTPTGTAKPAPTEGRPKKSLEELKAELGKARQPTSAPGGTGRPDTTAPATRDKSAATSADDVVEIELDESSLGAEGVALKKAFEEKRVIQAFQPVISLLNDEMDTDDEIHSVSLQKLDEDGSIRHEDEIRSQLTTPEFQKYVDRWLLRDIIGMLTSREKLTETLIMRISDASLADAGFFNWLRKLLTGLDSRNPGRFIILEIDCKHLATLEKQASALISYLRKTHEFKFVLGGVGSVDDIVKYCGKISFDMVRCNHGLIKELQSMDPYEQGGATAESTEGQVSHSQLQNLRAMDTRFIADDITDATTLTEAISHGTEYAMGEFIGGPVTQLEDKTNIESFEII